ncbi:MAG TPA: hypothetical protein VIL85_24490 [Thermomicrobiales bacterium]|jgi:hypothetical protein
MERPADELARLRRRLRHVLWLGGTPCSGKSAVAQQLLAHYPLQLYHYDRYEQAHLARRDPARHPTFCADAALTMDERWVQRPVQALVRATVGVWRERFAMVLDDLLALPTAMPILAEGPGLLPADIAPLLTASRQAIWLVPTEAFKRAIQPTRGGPANQTSDPARAYQHLIALDLQLAVDVRHQAEELGLTVLVVDGSRSIPDTATFVAQHFGLPVPTADRADG